MNDWAAPFSPDWVSPPGETILDIIEERDWTQEELAQRMGYTAKHVNRLIKGKVPLSEDAAIRLERVVGSTVEFWLAREAKYRERCARLAEAEKFSRWSNWLDILPLKEMMNVGAIKKCRIDAKSKSELIEACLGFYGVASPEEWQGRYGQMQASFRLSREEQSDVGAISAWLRMGEQIAEKQEGVKFNRAKFIKVLNEIRKLTALAPEQFKPKLTQYFKSAGVVFVVIEAIPKAHVSGVARWLNPHRPLIQLSLDCKNNDKFWFTLFHEAAHVILHGKEKKSVFLDDLTKNGIESKQEQEANDWARNFLIPDCYSAQLNNLHTKAAVKKFATLLGIHPAIVVGRIQHDGIINTSSMNDLRESFKS